MTDSREDDLIRPLPIEGPDSTTETVRARQLGRARVTAWLLGGFVILVFAISIVKITQGYGP